MWRFAGSGDGSRVALDLDGQQLSYRELEGLVAAHRSHLSGPVRCDPVAPPTQILLSLLAAIQAGVSWYLGPPGVLPEYGGPGADDGGPDADDGGPGAGDGGPGADDGGPDADDGGPGAGDGGLGAGDGGHDDGPGGPDADDGGPWLYLATSGTTTGRGRVIRRTWQSWHTSFAPLAELTGIGPDDVVYLSGPLSGTMHLFAAVHTLAMGAQLTDRPAVATATHCTPATLRTLLAEVPPELRTVIVAGDRLPAEVRQAAELAGIAVTEYYGAAELSFVAARRPGAAAMTAFPGVSLRILDGLLWAKSPYLAAGYAAGQGSWRQDADGYRTVGDHAQWLGPGPDGTTLRILGRDSTAVTVSGVTILVEEVEAVLAGLPGVRAAAIVGLPHPRLGATLLAIVETEPDVNPTAIRAAARAELSGAYLPRRFVRTTALPRNTSGKIARDTLRRGVLDDSYPLRRL